MDHGPAGKAVAPALPVLLADRQGVAFVATPRDVESLRIPRRYWGMHVGVVPVPVSEEEIRGTELQPSGDAGTWPSVVPRADLLAPALSRLLSGEHTELSLQPSRDGLKALLITAQDEEQPFPVAPKDAIGFLAAVFAHAPRGVIRLATGRTARVLLEVRPAAERHEYRVRLAGVVDGPAPATLADLGFSPAALEMALEGLERPVGLFLVSGGPGSGRSTTLDLLAATLGARGRGGGRVGPRRSGARPDIPWLAATLSDWPFPESILASASDFVVVDHLNGPGDLVLAARLAAGGSLVLAAAPAADPEALAATVARDLQAGSAPAVPVMVLGQSLIRAVCRGCIQWRSLPPAQARRHGFHRRDIDEMERQGGLAVPAGRGCSDCAGTGSRGLTGVFELYGPDGASGSLPRVREEGWRKVVQGIAGIADVAALPGAHRPLRSMREILVHAGLNPTIATPHETQARQVTGPIAAPRDGRPSPTPAPAGGAPATEETRRLGALLQQAARGEHLAGAPIAALARQVAALAGGDGPLAALLAPQRGLRLAAHSINTALIAVRVAARAGHDLDPEFVATLGLLHDAGLVRGRVDPEVDLPAILFEESIDPEDRRLDPGPVLEALGARTDEMIAAIRQAHTFLGAEPPLPDEIARGDVRAQIVALASLADLHLHSERDRRALDLHEVTPIMMERHGRRFGAVVFRAFLKAVPIFPIGSLVELSSGDLARVVSLNENNHFRPRVEIAAAGGGEGLGERRVVDLARAPFLHIRQRVTGAVPATQVAV